MQNTENRQFFIDHDICVDKLKLLPGSGVNLTRFSLLEYPDEPVTRFVFIARIMKEKGIDEYLAAAKIIREKYPNTEFHICGFCEAEYKGKLNEYVANKTVIYHGLVMDIREILKNMNCVILPSYYPEGINNSLLEAAASGRPVITTDRSGCRETVDDGISGFIINIRDVASLTNAIEKFLSLSLADKKQQGLNGRKKMEVTFDRQIVVNAYIEELNSEKILI